MKRVLAGLVLGLCFLTPSWARANYNMLWSLEDSDFIDKQEVYSPPIPPVIGDLDGDGEQELAYVSGFRLVVVNLASGEEEFSFTSPIRQGSNPSWVVGVNIDSDPAEELLFGAMGMFMNVSYLFDGQESGPPMSSSRSAQPSGYQVLWNVSDGNLRSSLASIPRGGRCLDIDGDGRTELVGWNTNHTQVVVTDGLTGYEDYRYQLPGGGGLDVRVIPPQAVGSAGSIYTFSTSGGVGILVGFTGVAAVGDTPAPVQLRIGATPVPSSGLVILSVETSEKNHLTAQILDASGRLVRQIDIPEVQPGVNSVPWDTRDDAGNTVASGVYWYRVSGGRAVASQKVVIIR